MCFPVWVILLRSFIRFMIIVSAILIVACAETDIDFDLFEQTYFPSSIRVIVEGAGEVKYLTAKFAANGKTFRSIVQNQSAAMGRPNWQIEALWRAIEAENFNPEGISFTRGDGRSYGHIPEVLEAERVNSETVCMSSQAKRRSRMRDREGNAMREETLTSEMSESESESECLLRSENEYSTARGLFSRYSLREILEMRRVVFIHSCSLPITTTEGTTGISGVEDRSESRTGKSSTRILEEILADLSVGDTSDSDSDSDSGSGSENERAGGLLTEADAVFVINFGLPVPTSVTSTYPGVVFVQASTDIARFEIPTLQIVHYFSKLSHALRSEVQAHQTQQSEQQTETQKSWSSLPLFPTSEYQILYLHTKGVSIGSHMEENPQIRDWRNFMTYFLVHNQRKCNKILRSNAIDVLGVNLRQAPLYTREPMNGQNEIWYYSGNFWWARQDYLAGLPRLSVHRNAKYDGEFWIGSAVSARMLSMHDSDVDNYNDRLPPSEYVNSPFLQSIP